MPLTPPYDRWVAEAVPGAPDGEARSTCATCPCAGYTLPRDSRCCSSAAEIPNYLVGRSLAVPSVQARLAARHGVGPLGFTATGWPTGTCPHLDQGACTVHDARPAACATWFCRHDRRARGARAWSALGDLLRVVESRVALWSAVQAGLAGPALHALLGPPGTRTDGATDDAAWAARWGSFAGREGEFYARCAELVLGLSWPQALAIAGIEAVVLQDAARAAVAALGDDRIPDRLGVGSHQVVGLGLDASLVVTHSVHDPYQLSAIVQSVLPFFDGRSTSEALAAMVEDRGVQLGPDALRELIDARLLVPV